mmetsp:Transcript_23220/g.31014  ORF Transcript_23220/g.31014 Transcript_23220/m.31014 type:complete len:93 (+) Transcript_23220:973-1251(+)
MRQAILLLLLIIQLVLQLRVMVDNLVPRHLTNDAVRVQIHRSEGDLLFLLRARAPTRTLAAATRAHFAGAETTFVPLVRYHCGGFALFGGAE